MSTAEVDSMLQANEQQRKFYDSRHAAATSGQSREQAANVFTDLWSFLRRRQLVCRRALGAQNDVLECHREWIASISTPQRRVLDLGCFTGNDLSLELAKNADAYLGIDLCADATAVLDEKLKAEGMDHAEARSMDFLNNDFEDGSFDLIYAHSVLHHFRYFDALMKELHRVCSPGGAIISYDPMKTSWSIGFMRAMYRPFQSDREWEFPFTMKTLRSIENLFDIKHARGVVGLAKYPMPLMMVPGLTSVGSRLCKLGHRLDKKHAVRPGFFLKRCLQVTMCLEKPAA